MNNPYSEIRVDRILLAALGNRSGRWILVANACALGVFLVSSWELENVLVAFWLEAVVVALVFSVFIALAPASGPTLLHRGGRIAVWILLAGTLLALTGATVSWVVAAQPMSESVEVDATFLPPIESVLGPAPWLAIGWIFFRSVAAFSDVFAERRFEHGIGLAAARFFVVYLPVLAGAAALVAMSDGAYQRFLPIGFLALLTYYELVLTLKLLPLLDREKEADGAPRGRKRRLVP